MTGRSGSVIAPGMTESRTKGTELTRTRALSVALMLVALGCNKAEQTTTTTYEPPPPAATETLPPTNTIAENPAAIPPGAAPSVATTATSVSPVTRLPISLTPEFTSPAGVDPAQAPRLSIESIEAEIKAGDVLLVDVRHPEAYQNSHAAGAVNIPLNEFPQRMGELPKEKYLVTYCT